MGETQWLSGKSTHQVLSPVCISWGWWIEKWDVYLCGTLVYLFYSHLSLRVIHWCTVIVYQQSSRSPKHSKRGWVCVQCEQDIVMCVCVCWLRKRGAWRGGMSVRLSQKELTRAKHTRLRSGFSKHKYEQSKKGIQTLTNTHCENLRRPQVHDKLVQVHLQYMK